MNWGFLFIFYIIRIRIQYINILYIVELSCFLVIKIKIRDSVEFELNCILIYILIIMNLFSIDLLNIGCFDMFMFLRIIYRLLKKIEICG